jgi:ABC-type multidrug transport system ATPase subunit
VRLYALLRGCDMASVGSVVEEVLDSVGIDVKDRNFSTSKMSGGNRRRLVLAIASIGNPPLMVLDGTRF